MSEFEFPEDRGEGDDGFEEDEFETIEPGDPSLENVVFVLLGVLGTLAVVVHIATLFG